VAQVKEAYRARAFAAHPDQGGDPGEFAVLAQAYREALAYAEKVPCSDCGGTGITLSMRGDLTLRSETCARCSGSGKRG
jgi:DnaJ-class molecular chaperone